MRIANVWESGKFDREQEKWVQEKLAKLPKLWARSVRARYQALKKNSLKAANEYVTNLIEQVSGNLNISASDDEIQDLAKKCAEKCSKYFANTLIGKAGFEFQQYDQCLALANSYAVRYPFEYDLNQQRARLLDDSWWLRNLRNAHAKAREAAAREAGVVHKKHDVYVSDDTLDRRRQQLKRNAELLDSIEMRNEHGEIMKLADIAKAGMANQTNRRNELMTRITGFEELAIKYSHKAVFVTLTCPSRMHRMLSSGKANQKYDGTAPDEAQKYLVHTWAKARALLAFNEVKYYGLRVAEPHHDGTPHWHMILFYDGKKSTLKKLKFYITKKFIEADRDELYQDVSPRVLFKNINPSDGTAAGYVIKYVSKNLGGIEGESDDEVGEGSSSETNAERVEAWASTWRIRQFQQLGGHSVTTWRELRRIDEKTMEGKSVSFVKLWQSAQKNKEEKRNANFAKYIEAMGGLNTPMRDSVYKVDYEIVTIRGRYGDAPAFKVLGVGERYGKQVAHTNRAVWQRV